MDIRVFLEAQSPVAGIHGLSDQEYRHVLIGHTGFLSSADPKFSDDDFKKILDHFKILGFDVQRKWE